jgi:5-formyltetrahydrofolate cyclo-ligase
MNKMHPRAVKERIRLEISRKRRYLENSEKEQMDSEIINKLENLNEWKKAKNILVYVAHKSEVQTKNLIEKYLKKKNIIVPKTHLRFHSLSLHHIKSLDDLFVGRYKLLEPGPHTKMIDPRDIDLAIVPGMVFDLKGHRIGYGKGYYDQLNKFLTCKKIGLAYNFQIIDNIPAEKHDQPIDILITEKEIHKFS